MKVRLERPPIIRLEVANKGEVLYTLFWLFFMLWAWIGIVASYEEYIYENYYQNPELNCTNLTGFVNESCYVNDYLWNGHFSKWENIQGAFTLTFQINPFFGNAAPVLPSNFNQAYTVQIIGERRTGQVHLFNKIAKKVTFSCDKKSCDKVILFNENDFSCTNCSDIIGNYKKWYTTVSWDPSGFPVNNRNNHYATYYYVAVGSFFGYLNLAFHVFLGGFALVWLFAWLYVAFSRSIVPYSEWIYERKLVVVMLILSCIGMSSPLYLVVLATKSQVCRLLNTLLYKVTLLSIWSLWFLMLSGLKCEQRSVIPREFYIYKLFWLFILIIIILIRFSADIANYIHNPDPPWTSSLLFVTNIMLYCLVGFFVLWFIYTCYDVGKCLTKLPYMRTRFRQLSYRYLVMIMGFNLVAMICNYIVAKGIGFDFDDLNNFYTGFIFGGAATAFYQLLSITLMSFMYLPPPPELLLEDENLIEVKSEISYESPVSLHTAIWLVDFASHAYRDEPDTINSKKGVLRPEFFGFTYHSFIECEENDTHALFAEQYGHLILSFRGTDSGKNILTDMKMKMKHFCGLRYCDGSCKSSKSQVHQGFLNAFNSLQDKIIEKLEKLGEKKLFITGHSLGGAMATLTAMHLVLRDESYEPTVYTYGSPRVGNTYFAQIYDKLVPNTFRIVNDGDPIPTIPKLSFFSMLQPSFKHVGIGVVCDRFGDIIIDPTFIERFLKTSGLKPVNHTTAAYRIAINSCIGALKRKYIDPAPETEGITNAIRVMTHTLIICSRSMNPNMIIDDGRGFAEELYGDEIKPNPLSNPLARLYHRHTDGSRIHKTHSDHGSASRINKTFTLPSSFNFGHSRTSLGKTLKSYSTANINPEDVEMIELKELQGNSSSRRVKSRLDLIDSHNFEQQYPDHDFRDNACSVVSVVETASSSSFKS